MNFSNEEFKREMNTFWIIKKKSHYLNIHIPYEYIYPHLFAIQILFVAESFPPFSSS